MKKRWVSRKDQNPELSQKLAKELNIANELASLLCSRNIDNYDKARQFFRPSAEHLHDPFLMNDMDLAVARIQLAIEKNEIILIYGDYDVDGTTAVSVVYSYIKSFYARVEYYIPDRYLEGYGISYIGIDWAEKEGISLIIALDCGIKSIEHINYANDKNIDFIIADHHQPGETLPSAVAVLDPKRSDSTYPFKELSGCGIGYKLVTALVTYLKQEPLPEGLYLDMVAISIAADMVEVCDENRVLAYLGLRQINTTPCLGLKALIKQSRLQPGNITFKEILFQLGPRINAAGRMLEAKKVVELLTCTEQAKAAILSDGLDKCNNARKELDTRISAEAGQLLQMTPEWESFNSTVLYKPEWHKGVVGIVASRVIEKHYRPTIILTGAAGKASGSARSVSGFNIYKAIESCQHLLEQFGGHEFAAGLSLDVDKIDQFRLEFEKAVTAEMPEGGFTRELPIDHTIDPVILDGKFIRILFQLAPFGPGNQEPVFMSENMRCHSSPSLIGGKHLKFQLRISDKIEYTCMGFNMERYYSDLLAQKSFDLCYSIENNSYNGETTIQLLIKDLKIHAH